jgi:hypothetical protein
MAKPAKKQTIHEQPTLTELEAENIIVRKKVKDREKPTFTEFEDENNDRQPQSRG